MNWKHLFGKHKQPRPAQRIQRETICPLCLERFPPETFLVEYPYCSDCGSEGIDFDVEPFEEYFKNKTLDDFDDMILRWDATEGVLPAYKDLKRARMVALRDEKAKLLA